MSSHCKRRALTHPHAARERKASATRAEKKPSPRQYWGVGQSDPTGGTLWRRVSRVRREGGLQGALHSQHSSSHLALPSTPLIAPPSASTASHAPLIRAPRRGQAPRHNGAAARGDGHGGSAVAARRAVIDAQPALPARLASEASRLALPPERARTARTLCTLHASRRLPFRSVRPS